MKKNIFLYIVLAVLTVFVIAFGLTAYKYYIAIHADDPIQPYVAAHNGGITVARGDIAIDMSDSEEYPLEEGDVVLTRADSEATVFWPDHSTTRLGSNTKMIIDVMQVSSDYSKIQLEARLEKGKVWSNIVRTLYPKSYVRFRLPKQQLVAGVRGSVFEINLEKDYIYSAKHALILESEILRQKVVLLQGEIVSVWDIFKKLSNEVLDASWVQINQTTDALYNAGRKASNELMFNMIQGGNTITAWWNRGVQSILVYIPGFEDLQLLRTIADNKIIEVKDISQEKVIQLMQFFKNTDFSEQKDLLRNTLFDMTKNLPNANEWLQSLQQEAFWEALSLPDGAVQGAQKFLEQSTEMTQEGIRSIQKSLKNGDFGSNALEILRSSF